MQLKFCSMQHSVTVCSAISTGAAAFQASSDAYAYHKVAVDSKPYLAFIQKY